YALLGLFSCPARQNERGVVILHERMITPLGAKTAPALGVRPEGSALGVRLDWRFFRPNRPHPMSVGKP
ncbi:MAG: hypothetical protein ACH253_18320, partial [Candidatus Thiodiazotropha sp.]